MSCNFRLSIMADRGSKGDLMTQKLFGEGHHLLKAEGRRNLPGFRATVTRPRPARVALASFWHRGLALPWVGTGEKEGPNLLINGVLSHQKLDV